MPARLPGCILLPKQRVGGRAVQVNEVIGNIVPALVEQIDDVDLAVANQCQDMAQGAGQVRVRYGDAGTHGALELKSREID